jgi:hypothetical protein
MKRSDLKGDLEAPEREDMAGTLPEVEEVVEVVEEVEERELEDLKGDLEEEASSCLRFQRGSGTEEEVDSRSTLRSMRDSKEAALLFMVEDMVVVGGGGRKEGMI